MNLEVANKLLKLRKENNLSQEELAERLGISRQAISKWERGEASPDTDNLIQLSNLYRVSLDELLGIDVKTYKSPKYPHSSSDMNAQTIRLTKSETDELDYIFSDTSSKRVVYPKDSLNEEIYPNSVEPPPFQEPIQNTMNQFSTPYKQQNPIVTTNQPKTDNNTTYQSFKYHKKSKKKKSFVPPFTTNKFINKFESLMAKFKISYKGLYTFPIYAIGIALAVFFQEILYYEDADYLSAMSVLGIPLYYTLINAIQHRNANRFGYPILALMMMLFGYFATNSNLSALWLATIPFYYWFINKDR